MNSLGIVFLVVCACVFLACCGFAKKAYDAFALESCLNNFVVVICFLAVAASVFGCAKTAIAPVRYQVNEVFITKPCFEKSQIPTPAIEMTSPKCALSRAECVRAARADIQELRREVRQYRELFKECVN